MSIILYSHVTSYIKCVSIAKFVLLDIISEDYALELEIAEWICKQLLDYPLSHFSANAETPIAKKNWSIQINDTLIRMKSTIVWLIWQKCLWNCANRKGELSSLLTKSSIKSSAPSLQMTWTGLSPYLYSGGSFLAGHALRVTHCYTNKGQNQSRLFAGSEWSS